MIRLKPLNRNEVLRYLGRQNARLDPQTETLLDTCEAELLQTATPRYVFKELPLPQPDLIRGSSIEEHLRSCDKAVVICATLGESTDKLIRTLQVNHMTAALITDSLAGAAIEQVCMEVDKLVAAAYPGCFLTYRFSPGYGDYPLEVQTDLLRYVDAPRKIGVTVTPSNMLVPAKSITAITGVAKEPLERKKLGCASCNLYKTCQFRKEGTRCDF